MRPYMKTLIATAAVLMMVPVVHAETVKTDTVVVPQDVPGTNQVNFMAFDLNGDGVLSRREIGEKLFRLFDQDGNGSIDNIEFDKKAVMTIIPMEKTTLVRVDYDDDGQTDQASVTFDDFVKTSHLMRFDENHDGLTPHEFIGKGIEELDKDQNKLIDLEEWKAAYNDSLHAPIDEPKRYNPN